jgi:hypothetical protein
VCLCNALTAAIGLGQVRPNGEIEPPLVTLGSDVSGVRAMAARHPDGWSAAEALEFLCPADLSSSATT